MVPRSGGLVLLAVSASVLLGCSDDDPVEPDTDPPQVQITGPTAGILFHDVETVTVTADDDLFIIPSDLSGPAGPPIPARFARFASWR